MNERNCIMNNNFFTFRHFEIHVVVGTLESASYWIKSVMSSVTTFVHEATAEHLDPAFPQVHAPRQSFLQKHDHCSIP